MQALPLDPIRSERAPQSFSIFFLQHPLASLSNHFSRAGVFKLFSWRPKFTINLLRDPKTNKKVNLYGQLYYFFTVAV